MHVDVFQNIEDDWHIIPPIFDRERRAHSNNTDGRGGAAQDGANYHLRVGNPLTWRSLIRQEIFQNFKGSCSLIGTQGT